MTIYKRSRGAELGTNVKQLQLVFRTGFEPATFRFQDVRHPNRSATLPPSLTSRDQHDDAQNIDKGVSPKYIALQKQVACEQTTI